MGRLARSEEICESEVGIYHVTSRCVRRAFLMGKDVATRRSYDERRDWLLGLLMRYAPHFKVDVISFSLMANHFHLVLRNRPDLVEAMSDEEVIRAWWAISPQCRKRDGSGSSLTPTRLKKLLKDEKYVQTRRARLSSISWFMRYVKHPVAVKANAEDDRSGHFFEGRFRATRVTKLAQLLCAMLYNDLNPVRAGIAVSIAESTYTSGQLRLQAAQRRRELQAQDTDAARQELQALDEQQALNEHVDSWLSPIELRQHDPILLSAALGEPLAELDDEEPPACEEDGSEDIDTEPPDDDPSADEQTAGKTRHAATAAVAAPHAAGLAENVAGRRRASDRGVLPISAEKYLVLLDAMGRREAAGKRGKIPAEMPRVLQQLGFASTTDWLKLYDEFAESMQTVYLSKVNDDEEAALVELPLVDESKSNQDAML